MLLTSLLLLQCLAGALVSSSGTKAPTATNVHGRNVTYSGLYRSGVEGFVGIRFAEDTSNEKRLKAPVPFLPPPNSHIDATEPGTACPQSTEKGVVISEDCLKLNVWRPANTTCGSKLSVLVWIYGGNECWRFPLTLYRR